MADPAAEALHRAVVELCRREYRTVRSIVEVLPVAAAARGPGGGRVLVDAVVLGVLDAAWEAGIWAPEGNELDRPS